MRKLHIAKLEKARSALLQQVREIDEKLAELDPDCWLFVEYDGTLSFPWDHDQAVRGAWPELIGYDGIVYLNALDVSDELVLWYDPTTGQVVHEDRFVHSVWRVGMDYGTYTAMYDKWTGELLDVTYSNYSPAPPKLHFRMKLPTSDAAGCGTEPDAESL